MDYKAPNCRKAIFFLRINIEFFLLFYTFLWNLFTLHLNLLPFKVDTLVSKQDCLNLLKKRCSLVLFPTVGK